VSRGLTTKKCPKTTPLQQQQMGHAGRSHEGDSCEQNIWEGIFNYACNSQNGIEPFVFDSIDP
jgi:hypothetical protein